MKRGTLFVLGTGTISLVLAAASGLAGCQNNNGTGGTGGEGAGTTGTNTMSSSSGSTGTSSSSSSSGTGGAAQEVTIQQLNQEPDGGTPIGPDQKVVVKGVVAMSHKFLVSQSSTGSCLWGVFISAPGLSQTGPYTGVLAVSYGTPATIPDGGTKAFCPVIQKGEPAGDGFPDDVKPGDVLDISGKTDSYIAKSCGTMTGDTTVPQVQLANVTNATKVGTAAVPTPHVLTADELTSFAGQTDSDFYKKWGGVKVRLENVTANAANPPKDPAYPIVGDYGKITLDGSNLVVGDKVYYHGLLNSLKDLCHSGPHYAANSVTFTKIDGFAYLDFCTWGLQPENRCVDLAPPSDDCGTETCP